MVHSIPEPKEQHSPMVHARKEEIATRLFSVVMFGLCAVFLIVAIFWDW